jgi:diacylglycerol O-acyltransferase
MAMLEGSAHAVPTPVWGTARAMTDVEALMWRAEADPRLRSDGVVLDLLDHAPAWDRLVAAHDWAARLAPRLHQRVVEDPLHLGPPRWVATDLDLGYHLSRVRLAEGAGHDQLLELAAGLHMAPFDRARPLWQAVLVEGLAEGRAAYLLKFHHAMADGQGAMQLFDLVHSHTAEPSPHKHAPARPAADPVTSVDLAVQHGASLVRAVPVTVAKLARKAGGVLTSPQSAVSYVQSLARVTSSPGTPSPLLCNRGLSRRVRTLEVELAALKAAGKAVGASLNDAYLAGLLGGLGHYHRAQGYEIDGLGDLPLAIPVSLRHDAHALGGNRFAGAYVAGPVGEPDPRRRMELVRDRVRAARAEPALDFLGVTAGVTSRLPSGVLAGLSLRLAGAIDLQASNIPGMRRQAYLGGARIEKMFVLGPVPGSAIMATLLSHDGTCCIGIVTDHDAVTDPDLLLQCLQKAFAEVTEVAS